MLFIFSPSKVCSFLLNFIFSSKFCQFPSTFLFFFPLLISLSYFCLFQESVIHYSAGRGRKTHSLPTPLSNSHSLTLFCQTEYSSSGPIQMDTVSFSSFCSVLRSPFSVRSLLFLLGSLIQGKKKSWEESSSKRKCTQDVREERRRVRVGELLLLFFFLWETIERKRCKNVPVELPFDLWSKLSIESIPSLRSVLLLVFLSYSPTLRILAFLNILPLFLFSPLPSKESDVTLAECAFLVVHSLRKSLSLSSLTRRRNREAQKEREGEREIEEGREPRKRRPKLSCFDWSQAGREGKGKEEENWVSLFLLHLIFFSFFVSFLGSLSLSLSLCLARLWVANVTVRTHEEYLSKDGVSVKRNETDESS